MSHRSRWFVHFFLSFLNFKTKTYYSGSRKQFQNRFCFFCFPLFAFFLFCLFSFFFLTCFFCAHHEGTNQAPIATAVSTHRKHSRTACNRPCTEQQSTYSSTSVRSCRQECVRQRSKQADKSKCYREPPCTCIVSYVSPCPLVHSLWGYLMRIIHPVCLSRLYSTPHYPEPAQSTSNQRPINVEYFQAQHPSRANQPINRAFTSDSIQALVTP